ncbi:MAG: molybdopterin-dependent oxidoreductase, partial [Phycisphaerales bacterium]
ETTWAQIVAHELGIPADDVIVEEGDTDTAPFGLGTYASRSTPVAGAAVSMVARTIRAAAAYFVIGFFITNLHLSGRAGEGAMLVC